MHHHVEEHPHQEYTAADEAVFSKISWHILPLLIVCYIIAFLDRVNIGFAQLQMKQTLPFSDAAYAFGAGVFFIGYFLFEVPSNLLLEKIGARKTLLRIMFGWGIVASAMIYVNSTTMFYILRFLLGALEAGFFPGIILYLTYWYPAARRAKVIAIFMTGATIAYLIAGPVSGATMKYMDGFLGHYGWQWLFVTQGLPASILGIVAFFYLKDKPEDAPWLTAAEKKVVRDHLNNDAHAVQESSHGSFLSLLKDPKIFTMSFVYFLMLGATYVMVFSSPSIIKSWGINDVFTIGLLTAVGPVFALVGMVLIGRSSDKHLERRKHFMFCAILPAIGAVICAMATGNVVLATIGLAILTVGQSSATPIFFAALSDYIPKKAAAGGIALVSSLGNLGPAISPSAAAWLGAKYGGFTAGLYMVAALWILSGIILMAALHEAPVTDPKLASA